MPRKRKFYNSLTGQRMDKKTGRFKPKPGSKTPTPPIVTSGDLMDYLAQYADPRILAKRIDRLARSGDGAMLALLIQAAQRRTKASDTSQQWDLSDFTFEEKQLLKHLIAKSQHKLDATGQRFLDRTITPSAFQMCMSDEDWEAEVNGEAEAEPEKEEVEPDPDPDVLYGFKLPESAPAPVKSPPTKMDPTPRASTGYRQRSLIGSMSNTSGGMGMEIDDSEHGASSDFDWPPDEPLPPAPKKRTN